jgi:hypothetical protein
MLSQVEAAAVTEEVSLIAVPAKKPKPLSDVWLKPSQFPRIGNKIAAMKLNKKITEIACATSSSSALITGAVAAIAEPPQMEEPTPIKIEIFAGTCMTLRSTYAITRAADIVLIIIGSDCLPISSITERFMPKPNNITAYCRIFLEVNLIPASYLFLSFINKARVIPIIIEIIGPPKIGKAFPSNQEGIARMMHSINPGPCFLIKFIVSAPFDLVYIERFDS